MRRSLRNIVISEPKIDFRGSAGEFIGEFYLQWSIEFSPSDYSFQTDVLCGMTFNATYRTFTGKWLPLWIALIHVCIQYFWKPNSKWLHYFHLV